MFQWVPRFFLLQFTELETEELPPIYWLFLLAGVLFASLVFYGIYRVMLYNQVAVNRHPANFRRVLWALTLLCSIALFTYIFASAWGWLVSLILFGLWLVLVIFFIVTRRKPAVQS